MLASVQNRDSPLSIEINTNTSTEESETTETISSVDDPGPSLSNDEKIIFNSNGQIVSGAADALLCQMLPTPNYSSDKETIFTLLLNLRAFISPNDLLQKLLQHCMFEQNSTSDNFRKECRVKMFENIYFFCKEWTTNIPYDFREPAMRDRLLEIFGLCVVDSGSQQKCDQLMFNLRSALSKLERYELALRSLNQNIEDPPSTTDQFVGLAILCSDPLIVAQQLAHIELERLSMIGADEFVELLKIGKIDDLGFVPQNAKTANIRHYVEWFNQLTTLVATEILRHSRKRYRAKAIEFFIEVARECINVGNFNSLMSIVAGLSLQPVSRLKRTWARVEKSKLEILQHQLDPSGNFLSYRATLKAAIWRLEGAKQDAEQVIIPFFGLLMKDLFMLFCRCLMPLPNGHLNYTAFLQFSENVRNILKWKSRQCPFPRNSQVLQYLLLAANYSETNMLRLSYDYEVAELSAEKEQYKRLRERSKPSS
uniref:Ras-GEF domain-containing protein n=1 Tax=Panagrolaimus sp. JU765 TaxID=591449 RepID=A0AC34QW15_9BILA